MKTHKKTKFKKTSLTFFIFIFLLSLMSPKIISKIQKPRQVNYIPLYAIDLNGNPAYDLKMNELELTINGKTVDIIRINRYFKQEDKEKIKPIKETKRITFIIIDAMFITNYGL